MDALVATVERDRDHGGGLIAGALAYRLFFWLLPVTLLVVAGLGFLSAADQSAPRDLAEDVGSFGFAAQSVADAAAAAERSRWWVLAVGLVTLYLASVSFVKALSIGNSLLWDVPAEKLRRKAVAAAVMSGVLLSLMGLLTLEGWLRERSPGPGLALVLGFMVVVGGAWVAASWYLPRPAETTWKDFVPGALLVAVGLEVVHLVTVYYVAGKLERASDLYGGLGTATAMLFSLYLITRLAVLAGSLNAELWERRQPRAPT